LEGESEASCGPLLADASSSLLRISRVESMHRETALPL